ncbi:MAG: GIY-YIG nuclease family protein [Alphaproteobacteria bacterium]|nr:GIY-YIG nuclease family protein [Alphaproteobacteria bacterium]
MGKRFTAEDDALLAELGVEAAPDKASSRTPREERIVTGFEDIQRFMDTHGRAPQHGEDRDISERLLAARLDRIRELEECRALLVPLDRQNLLVAMPEANSPASEDMDDDALLAELGVETAAPDIAELRHVRSSADKRAAEEIANRTRCEDFGLFRPLFEQVQRELETGLRRARPFELKSEIRPGNYFVVSGQKAYVAEMGEVFSNAQGRTDARLRVIFDNGTESNLLMRSLQRSLHKDEAGRRITNPSAGPLFADQAAEGDQASGIIYVLRSKADIPFIAEKRNLVHKIGVTNGKVETRIVRARQEPTFLMADVEIVATYKLYNIDRGRLEKLIHRIFAPARLDIEIEDRFGNPVVPREWFLAPLDAIDDAVGKIRDGTITQYFYNVETASLAKRS